MSYNPAATRHSDHPGFRADSCPLRETVQASPRGTSQNGFRCAFTGGHCQPCDACPSRIARADAELASLPEDVIWD